MFTSLPNVNPVEKPQMEIKMQYKKKNLPC